MNEVIEHKGVIINITNATASVKIEQTSACAGCHARGACSAFDKKEKIIDALINDEESFALGEEVMIQGNKSIGTKAVFIAFVIPFILILVTLAVSLHYITDEGASALISLGILIPYYSMVFLMRNKLQREFTFFVRKI